MLVCVILFACAHFWGKGVHGHNSENRFSVFPYLIRDISKTQVLILDW